MIVFPLADFTQAEEGLMGLLAYMEDLSEPLVAVAEKAKEQTLRRYETEVGPDGSSWTPLASSTVTVKDERGDPGVLRETDTMMESLHLEPPEPFGIEMGYEDAVKYAAVHQFGQENARSSKGGWKPTKSWKKTSSRGMIPARPTLGMSEDDASELKAVLVAHLQRVFGNA